MNYHQVIINESGLNTNGTLGNSYFADASYPSVSLNKGGQMNKIVFILLTFLLTSCASYQPVTDLKASKNANDYQEDKHHCRLLIKEEFNAFYAAWYDRELLSRCLNGRGHNVLNTYTIGN